MSHRLQVLIALLLGVVVGIGVVSCNQRQTANAAREPAAAPQWEYKLVKPDADDGKLHTEKHFNDLAADGWEYTGTVSWCIAIFRRAKK